MSEPAAATTYYDPHQVTYDTTAVTGCVSVDVRETAVPHVSRSDDGEVSIFVPAGHVEGTLNFNDVVQANDVARKTAAGKSLTFKVHNDAGTDLTCTLSGIKTGGVVSRYAGASAGTASVPFAAESFTEPTAG